MTQQNMWKIVLSILIGSVCMTGVWSCPNVWGEECQKKPNGDPDILRMYSFDKWLDEEEETAPGPGAFTFIDPHGADVSLLRLSVCVPDGEKAVKLTFPEHVEIYLAEIPPVPEIPPVAISTPLLVPFSTDVWVNVKEAGQNNIICASTTSACEDEVMVTGVQVDMTIHHGNASRTEVHEEEEDTRGAFTVVNRNDTDADGIVDHIDNTVVAGSSGQNESDLMKLVIQKLGTDDLQNIPGFGDIMTLTIVAGQNKVVLWEESTKQTPTPGSNGLYEFKVADLGNTDKAVWIEVITPSDTLGDIELELKYMERKDTVKATGIWPEVDVREEARPYNRIGRDDPRMTDDDMPARNKLLVWHDAGDDHAITFEVRKTDIPDGTQFIDNNSPIWIQLERIAHVAPYDNQSWEFLTCEMISNDVEDFQSLQITSNASVLAHTLVSLGAATIAAIEDHFIPDVLVKYGIDYNGSGTLSDDEIMGQHEIFGITQDDYDRARARYNYIYLQGVEGLNLVSLDLAKELCFRFSQGTWEGPPYEGYDDYRPDRDASCAPGRKFEGEPNDSCSCPGGNLLVCPSNTKEDGLTDSDLTHNVGALFLYDSLVSQDVKHSNGTGGAYPRQYFDAGFAVPVYFWNDASDAAELIRNDTNQLRKKIFKEFLFPRSNDIKKAYDGLGGVGEKTVTFSSPIFALDSKGNEDKTIQVGATGRIGLGGATIHPGSIALRVKKHTINNITYYDVSHEIELMSFEIEDGFDYNYFKVKPKKAKYTLASVSGSSVQTGFEQPGALPFAGQVPREKIDISGTLDMTPVNDPDPGWARIRISWFRMDSTGNWLSVIEQDGTPHSMTWFEDWMEGVQ